MKDGSLAWRAFSMGPDEDMLVDPNKTTHMGKPIGKDSSLRTAGVPITRAGSGTRAASASTVPTSGKIGGGSVWGFHHGRPGPEPDLLRHRQPRSTWNPVVRPGDNKWSMTIMARDIDTGMAKWFYQKTPFDEWDYDGVNENILVDMESRARCARCWCNFDRNGFAYTMTASTASCWWPRSSTRPSTGRRTLT
jgi:lanthanide-dependent methanol dehydrogenase